MDKFILLGGIISIGGLVRNGGTTMHKSGGLWNRLGRYTTSSRRTQIIHHAGVLRENVVKSAERVRTIAKEVAGTRNVNKAGELVTTSKDFIKNAKREAAFLENYAQELFAQQKIADAAGETAKARKLGDEIGELEKALENLKGYEFVEIVDPVTGEVGLEMMNPVIGQDVLDPRLHSGSSH